jgi:hypothetical protein
MDIIADFSGYFVGGSLDPAAYVIGTFLTERRLSVWRIPAFIAWGVLWYFVSDGNFIFALARSLHLALVTALFLGLWHLGSKLFRASTPKHPEND